MAAVARRWFLTGPFPPRSLMASRRYYFELLHKQDDRGSDHVEVGVSEFPSVGSVQALSWQEPAPGLFLTRLKTLYVSPPFSVLLGPHRAAGGGDGGDTSPGGSCLEEPVAGGQESPEESEQSGAPRTPGWLMSPHRGGRDAG